MFPRILYVDDQRALELDWLGFGAIQVRHRAGPVRRANRIQKQVLLAVVEAFAQTGQPVSPSNPRCSVMLKEFVELIEKPMSSLAWKVMLNANPIEIGQAYANN